MISNVQLLLCSALEPSSLHQAVYPVLTSYSTPDTLAYPRHSLSRAALITSGSPIFFLDAFTTLIVFYSSTADPTLPFPPPHDCKHAFLHFLTWSTLFITVRKESGCLHLIWYNFRFTANHNQQIEAREMCNS